MYIRTKDEALDALAEILNLPERRAQIIQMSVKIMVCLEPEPRAFLVDCMATLIENGLEFMRRKRQEALAQLEQSGEEALVIVDADRDDLLEEIGTALDALRMAGVAREVFPQLGERYEEWEVARAVLRHEAAVRETMIQGVRLQGHARSSDLAPGLEPLDRLIREAAPEWGASAGPIRAICRDAVLVTIGPDGPGAMPNDPDLLFAVIALEDRRAHLVLNLLADGRHDALAYLNEVRQRLAVLREMQAREAEA